ncbi:MAG: PilZ domain-containing protein [Sandaracinaceae bacterium]
MTTNRRRAHERFEHRLDVVVKHPEGEIACATQNISLGGMSLLTDELLEYGVVVQLSFRLPALKEPVLAEATVRWVKDDGFGVQFGSLRAREVWALNQLFRDAPG